MSLNVIDPCQAYIHALYNKYICNVVSSNVGHSDVYSIQPYVIKFASDLRQVGCLFRVLRFPPLIKLTVTISLKYC